jgi:hypothetical protein
MMVTAETNTVTFVRTLRSTGCKAAIIVFCDYMALRTFTADHLRFHDDCGVVFVDFGVVPNGRANITVQARHLLYYDFLTEYRSTFDRVIIADMYDTLFQQDPFTTDFGYHTMGVTSEAVTLNADPTINTAWLKIADPDYAADPKFYDDKIALSSGLLFGSTEAMLMFYNVFLGHKFYDTFPPTSTDQGHLNFLYHKGVFAKSGLKIRVTQPGDYIVSARGAVFRQTTNWHGMFQVVGYSSSPAVIHQYSRICPIMARVKKFCPALRYDRSPYARVLDQSPKCE